MKQLHRVTKFLLISLLLALSLTAATAVFAQTTATAVIATGALNVRHGPGVEYSINTTVYLGETVTLLGRNNNNSWVKVRTSKGAEGWINAAYITPNNVAISNLPVATTTAAPATPPPTPVQPGGIAVRSGPGFNYPAIGFVNNGSNINLIGRNADNSWLKVSSGNITGWMNASIIETSIDINTLPIVDGSGGTVVVAGSSTASVTTGALNVRSGPGVGYSISSTVYLGQVVTLLARNSDSSWVKVQTVTGLQGWVSTAYIQTAITISSLPEIATPSLNAVGWINTGAANMRSGPSLEFTSIATVGLGTSVTLIGRNSSGSWLNVQLANGTKGWINASLLDVNTTISTLPITG